ncbi:hypothetical protein GCM10010331_44130 [Streptomyces xanthochromogenes]|nr:hypothetical protein GCM10010331_44130 [Streptomyces xanthochromogenes]
MAADGLGEGLCLPGLGHDVEDVPVLGQGVLADFQEPYRIHPLSPFVWRTRASRPLPSVSFSGPESQRKSEICAQQADCEYLGHSKE